MTNEQKQPYDPPFDDSASCPMCPWQIRNLAAVAHNLTHEQPGTAKFWVKLGDLRRAVEAVQPFADAHFASESHSHPLDYYGRRDSTPKVLGEGSGDAG